MAQNQSQNTLPPKLRFTIDKDKKQQLIQTLTTELLKVIRAGVAEQLTPVKEDLKKLQENVTELTNEVKGLKSDLKEVRDDFNAFRDSRYKMDREVAEIFNRGHHQLLPHGDDE